MDKRIGFVFDNPDLDSDYLAPKFGLIVTPDELRYDELFGNPLTAEADSMTFTDEQLLDYGRYAMYYVEDRLNLDIVPRRIRYTNRTDKVGNEIERDIPEDNAYLSSLKKPEQKSYLYKRESGYRGVMNKNYSEIRVKLRRHPVRKILTAQLNLPNGELKNILPNRVFEPGLTGVVYFRQNIRSAFYGGVNAGNSLLNSYGSRPFGSLGLEAILIDYESGYENAAEVPVNLRWLMKKIAAIYLMATYGDGKMSAVASSSVSLAGISESLSTTMSATSAAYGARILQYQKEVKEWFSDNTCKYARPSIGKLGN